ncbi:sensor domain-containing diguanylate cyclase [Desulfovibrio intestinalis]|uniref:diguanylate cyclase n=1 Tax=Desulfovibrio intestinalis TaxID=58621 RepID=A0A7W8FGW6_9BACT|nr:diguanylate cyclase [Desulfovibrio intestinalis]MBB5144351.1 diguanylate cyclase (GGDEF)-like protein/PAS domain S-box-containing protein [Desulfovibrio intestinalis]
MESKAWKICPELKYLRVCSDKEKMLGLPEGGLIGKSFLDFMEPEEASRTRQFFYGSGGEPRSFSRVVVRYLSPDGFLLVLEISGAPVFDAGGIFVGFEGEDRDIAAIPTNIAGIDLPQLEQIFGMAPIAICAVGRDGLLLAVNAMHAALSGRSLMSLIGVKVGDLHPESGQKIIQDFKLLDAGGHVPDHEVVIVDRDYLVSVTPIAKESGKIIAICVIHLDITIRKRLELQVAVANQRLEEMNARDYLTGAYNRRYFDEFLTREVLSLGRTGGCLGVAFIDVDFFKLFNDVYGHLAGDHCLASIVKAMTGSLLRSTDCLFRYGGEEFVVVMPGTDDAGAMVIAERLRKAVYDLNIPHSESPWGRVTISIGVRAIEAVCAYCEMSTNEEIVKAADEALYRAKANGRNAIASSSQICAYEQGPL